VRDSVPSAVYAGEAFTQGDYAPIDRKVAAGLLAKDKITRAQRSILLGKEPQGFSEVYVGAVLPAWLDTRKTMSPQDADEYWGSASA
jgi:hypothetical protein